MVAPIPSLTYRIWHDVAAREREYHGGDVALASVHEVAAYTRRDELHLVVSGRMLTKAGEPGPRRSSEVDLSKSQPDWLMEIRQDALARLPEALRAVCICRPEHRTNDPICRWQPEQDQPVATVAASTKGA